MHIAYITHEYPPDTGKGGIATYTKQMAGIMKDLGHEVEVFCASFDREESESWNGILTHRIRISEIKDFRQSVLSTFSSRHTERPFDLLECPELGGEAEYIKQKYPDLPLVVRLHTPAVLVTRLQNSYLPVSAKLRFILGSLRRGKIDFGTWSRHDKNQYSDPDYLITTRAEKIIAPSQAMKSWAFRFWKIPLQKIEVIPNPFETDPELLNIPAETQSKYITFLGRLNVLKGLVALTHALPFVLDKNPEWKIRFIGNDERSHKEGLSMKEWIESKLSFYHERIEFIDWIGREELPVYLKKTDIVVIPSLFESFSYVCAEAMSAARGIVGSKNGGMKELLGNTGIVINPESPRKIGDSLNHLIANPEERINRGKEARSRILDQYNGYRIGRQVMKVYHDITSSTSVDKDPKYK